MKIAITGAKGVGKSTVFGYLKCSLGSGYEFHCTADAVNRAHAIRGDGVAAEDVTPAGDRAIERWLSESKNVMIEISANDLFGSPRSEKFDLVVGITASSGPGTDDLQRMVAARSDVVVENTGTIEELIESVTSLASIVESMEGRAGEPNS